MRLNTPSHPFRPLLAVLTPLLAMSSAHAAGILTPNDFIIGIDNNRNLPGTTNAGGEFPAAAFDNNNTTKWLSFGRSWTGLIVTPVTAGTVVESLQFTTGGDAPERDPISYQLFGTNEVISSLTNSDGLAENWSLISSGSTGFNLATQAALARNTDGPLLSITNSTAYNSYKVVFTALRKANANPFDPVTLANGANPNSIQLSEFRMFDGASQNIFATAPTAPVIAIDQTDSFFPPGERPIEAIDGNKTAGSKYLNFGREGSGLIITPAVGSSTIRGFQLTTANDVPERDPGSYEIYGTNSSILSLEDSNGAAEPWTLITSGGLSLPAGRNLEGGIIGFDNEIAYTSYKIIFPDNKGLDTAANSIQFSELEFFETPEPTSIGLLGVAGASILGLRRRRS